jgi:hypothetical protein
LPHGGMHAARRPLDEIGLTDAELLTGNDFLQPL